MSVLLRGLSQATGLGIPQTAAQSGLASSLREVKREGPVQMGEMKPLGTRSDAERTEEVGADSGALASRGGGQSKANGGGRLTGDLTGGAVFLCLVPCWHNPLQVPRDALGKDIGVFLNVLHVGQLQGLWKPESHIT